MAQHQRSPRCARCGKVGGPLPERGQGGSDPLASLKLLEIDCMPSFPLACLLASARGSPSRAAMAYPGRSAVAAWFAGSCSARAHMQRCLCLPLTGPPHRRRRRRWLPGCCSKSGEPRAGFISLSLYRAACFVMLLYIAATTFSGSGRTPPQQVQLGTRAGVSEAAALQLCASKGWVGPGADPAAREAFTACNCNCGAVACPPCSAAPDAAAVAAAKASATPPATTFCPWSSRYSAFNGHTNMVSFGRGESVCADTIL